MVLQVRLARMGSIACQDMPGSSCSTLHLTDFRCRNGKDYVGQGCGQCYNGVVHQSGLVRVCAEVSRRGEHLLIDGREETSMLSVIKGPRMVRDVFRLARENSPCIIFIDEVDAIATKRFDAQTGSDREVQRILLELLNQMDGFDQQTTVKVSKAHT